MAQGNAPPVVGPRPLKQLAGYSDLGRGPITSYYRRIAALNAPPSNPPKNFFSRLVSFGKGHGYQFVAHVMRYARSPYHAFQTYTKTGQAGIYSVEDKFSLGVAGDWGTGTKEAYFVTTNMQSHSPDYTIHLGDVYYVGDLPELRTNCLGRTNKRHSGVKWLPGTLGSFALNGNHEMYACGDAYFKWFLPKLGLKVQGQQQLSGQKASFFCLQNKHWRVIGLDTGYNSAGLGMTLLNALSHMKWLKWIKWLRKTPCFKPKSNLEPDLLTWLSTVVTDDPDDDKAPRPATVLLSHHQYFSGFDDWFRIPGQQLYRFFRDRPVLWFWGHEHRFALYDRFQNLTQKKKPGIDAYGRCIGHGGMPVDRGTPDITDCKCVFYDDRQYPVQGVDAGYNGFATMLFAGRNLQVNYYDLENTLMLTENWKTDDYGNLSAPVFTHINNGLTKNDLAYIAKHSAPPQPSH